MKQTAQEIIEYFEQNLPQPQESEDEIIDFEEPFDFKKELSYQQKDQEREQAYEKKETKHEVMLYIWIGVVAFVFELLDSHSIGKAISLSIIVSVPIYVFSHLFKRIKQVHKKLISIQNFFPNFLSHQNYHNVQQTSKKLTSIQNFLNYQNEKNNLFFYNFVKSIDLMLQTINPADVTANSSDATIKNNFNCIENLTDKKINCIEHKFWSLYIRTGERLFYNILYHMLSGNEIHFVFKTITNFALLAISFPEYNNDNALIVEPSRTIDEFYDNNKNSESFANAYYGRPRLKEYNLQFNHQPFKGMLSKKSTICSKKVLFFEDMIWDICTMFEKSELPKNITFKKL